MENEYQESRDYSRQKYVIKDFQVKFVVRFCILIVLGAFVMGGILYMASQGSLTTVFEKSRLTIKSTADFILPMLLLSISIMVVLTCLASVFVVLMFSHRIAGPLYRFEKHFESLKDGYLSDRIFLRSSDEIKELASACNNMTKELNEHIVAVKTDAYRLSRLEDVLRENLGGGKKTLAFQELEESLYELTCIRESLHKKLEFFKTT